jgi:ATP phosphoribosyltransferase regulatory subunit
MARSLLSLPSGFRDLLFEEADRRRTAETALAAEFARSGYGEVRPSTIEFVDLYSLGNQIIGERAFKFLDRDDHLLALRADFTPAVARIVSTRLRNASGPQRFWYSGDVFRRPDPKRGSYSEVWQVGAELIGTNGLESDAEVIDLSMRCLEGLGCSDVRIHLNHADVFRGVIAALQLDDSARERVKTYIDHKDARGLANQLLNLGAAPETERQLQLLSRCIGDSSVLDQAERAMTQSDSIAAIAHLRALGRSLKQWEDRIVYDLTEIDEMEYYTGTMFTLFSAKAHSELGGGGRYDTLLRDFGVDLPAVGFSFTMDAVLGAL